MSSRILCAHGLGYSGRCVAAQQECPVRV